MKLTKSDRPHTELDLLRNQLNTLFERTFDEFEPWEKPLAKMTSWKPAIELHEEKDEYVMKVELPGVNKEDINIEINENQIIISGETEQKRENKKDNIYRSEFRYGKYMRTISMPSEINTEETKAEFKNGILKIEAPKVEKEHKKYKKLTVK